MQRGEDGIRGGFREGEAVDGGAGDAFEVGVVGLVVEVRGLAEVSGDGGVNDTGVEAGGGEGVASGEVMSAGTFDGDDEVAESVVVRA